VAKVRRDGYVVAAILAGSLAYDTVWEKSDIDILLVGRTFSFGGGGTLSATAVDVPSLIQSTAH
jgi:predicted nucleotidyltransferase